MVGGVILLVDAAEGPMPQTRFVTSKALELGLKVIVVINKIDRPDARCTEVVDEVLELLLDLDASEEQLDSPVLFCSGRDGTASFSPDHPGTDLAPLFEAILERIDPPEGDENGPLQMLVSSIDYNSFVGRIAIGKIERGRMRPNMDVVVCDYHDRVQPYKAKVVNLYTIEDLKREKAESAMVGDIVCVSGIEGITIGEDDLRARHTPNRSNSSRSPSRPSR